MQKSKPNINLVPFRPSVAFEPNYNENTVEDFKFQYNTHNAVHTQQLRAQLDYFRLQKKKLKSEKRVKEPRLFAPKKYYKPKNYNKNQNILVVLFGFKDQAMKTSIKHFEDLFFSEGVLPRGSVREYFREVSGGKIAINGSVIESVQIKNTQKHFTQTYPGGGSGGITNIHSKPNARHMAAEVINLLPKNFDFSPYINNHGRDIVDGIVLVHAGEGRETSKIDSHIHSHHGGLPEIIRVNCNSEIGTCNLIEEYVVLPEDAKIGVCCHELAHLLFDLPDLYDTQKDTGAAGDWCLMGTGCWNFDGEIPAHMSAHCKAFLGWVDVEDLNGKSSTSLTDVKIGKKVYSLWRVKPSDNEWFLLEYREPKTGTFDEYIPGKGLLIWHIDSSFGVYQECNNHRIVSLEQADGKRHLSIEKGGFGDHGDPFPGNKNNMHFTEKTIPNSRAYFKCEDSKVRLHNIRVLNSRVCFLYSNIG